MDGILCYVAIQGDRVRRSSLETLSRFRETGGAAGLRVDAIILHPKAEQFVDAVAAYGPARVLTVRHRLLERHLNEPFVRALERGMETAQASTLAMASSEGAKDVLGALGVRLDSAVLADVATVQLNDGVWEVTRPVMAAKRLARTRSLSPRTIVSVRSGAYVAVESPSEPEVVDVSLDVAEDAIRASVREFVTSASGQIDLAEANVVVAAGRGVKDDEGARLVNELASLLGGAVGATRAVVESGMFPATAQIGQTGKVVSPDLYFALGISGAIQHVAGMSNSRVIVAVNKDPDAPIFKYSSYGIVGDLYKVLPPLIDQLRVVRAG